MGHEAWSASHARVAARFEPHQFLAAPVPPPTRGWPPALGALRVRKRCLSSLGGWPCGRAANSHGRQPILPPMCDWPSVCQLRLRRCPKRLTARWSSPA